MGGAGTKWSLTCETSGFLLDQLGVVAPGVQFDRTNLRLFHGNGVGGKRCFVGLKLGEVFFGGRPTEILRLLQFVLGRWAQKDYPPASDAAFS